MSSSRFHLELYLGSFVILTTQFIRIHLRVLGYKAGKWVLASHHFTKFLWQRFLKPEASGNYAPQLLKDASSCLMRLYVYALTLFMWSVRDRVILGVSLRCLENMHRMPGAEPDMLLLPRLQVKASIDRSDIFCTSRTMSNCDAPCIVQKHKMWQLSESPYYVLATLVQLIDAVLGRWITTRVDRCTMVVRHVSGDNSARCRR